MQFDFEKFQLFIMVIICLVLWEFIKNWVRSSYGKMTRDTDSLYVLKTECELSRKECLKSREGSICSVEEAFKIITDEMNVFRSILLVLAVKSGIPVDELKELTQRKVPYDFS